MFTWTRQPSPLTKIWTLSETSPGSPPTCYGTVTAPNPKPSSFGTPSMGVPRNGSTTFHSKPTFNGTCPTRATSSRQSSAASLLRSGLKCLWSGSLYRTKRSIARWRVLGWRGRSGRILTIGTCWWWMQWSMWWGGGRKLFPPPHLIKPAHTNPPQTTTRYGPSRGKWSGSRSSAASTTLNLATIAWTTWTRRSSTCTKLNTHGSKQNNF